MSYILKYILIWNALASVGVYGFKGYIPNGRFGLQENCRMVICGLELSSWTMNHSSGERSGIHLRFEV